MSSVHKLYGKTNLKYAICQAPLFTAYVMRGYFLFILYEYPFYMHIICLERNIHYQSRTCALVRAFRILFPVNLDIQSRKQEKTIFAYFFGTIKTYGRRTNPRESLATAVGWGQNFPILYNPFVNVLFSNSRHWRLGRLKKGLV